MLDPTPTTPGSSTPPPGNEVLLFDVHGHNWRWGTNPDGTPWAVAADVAPAFDYSQTKNALALIDEDEKGFAIIETPSGPQRMSVIYEDGIWELIFRSGKPEAKLLKKRIKQILRQLRTGELKLVSAGDQLAALELANQNLGKAISIARAEQARADAAEEQLAIAAPKAQHWEVLASADGDSSVADAAKILSRDPQITTGRDRLFATMSDLGWVYRQRGDRKWRAYQRAVDAGWLCERKQTRMNADTGRREEVAPQVRVTSKGLGELRRRLGGHEELPMAA